MEAVSHPFLVVYFLHGEIIMLNFLVQDFGETQTSAETICLNHTPEEEQ